MPYAWAVIFRGWEEAFGDISYSMTNSKAKKILIAEMLTKWTRESGQGYPRQVDLACFHVLNPEAWCTAHTGVCPESYGQVLNALCQCASNGLTHAVHYCLWRCLFWWSMLFIPILAPHSSWAEICLTCAHLFELWARERWLYPSVPCLLH